MIYLYFKSKEFVESPEARIIIEDFLLASRVKPNWPGMIERRVGIGGIVQQGEVTISSRIETGGFSEAEDIRLKMT